MAINPNIRDQAYQFFVQEAPELLQELESGLLILSQARSTAQVHTLMRAAHSLKGGAASIGLEAIATIAHRLENVLKALYSESLTIDQTLENQLLQAYDCLRLPLTDQILTGQFDPEQAIATAEPIFSQIEAQLGDALIQSENYVPTSADLGIDMVQYILEVDIAQALHHLDQVIAQPQDYEVAGELRAQVEVLAGFAELFRLPGFSEVAQAVQTALHYHPELALDITQLAIADFERSRQAILNHQDTANLGPSESLRAIAEPFEAVGVEFIGAESVSTESVLASTSEAIALSDEAETDQATEEEDEEEDTVILIPCLEDIFGGAIAASDPEPNFASDPAISVAEVNIPRLEDIFGGAIADPDEAAMLEFLPLDEETQIDEDEVVLHESFTAPPAELTPLTPASLGIESESIVAELIEDQTNQTWADPVSEVSHGGAIQVHPSAASAPTKRYNQPAQREAEPIHARFDAAAIPMTPTIRVDVERLQRMNNWVGELTINRDGLSRQNEQLQSKLKELLNRFGRFRGVVNQLREISDQILIASDRVPPKQETTRQPGNVTAQLALNLAELDWEEDSIALRSTLAEFDALEMDRYGSLHAQVQGILEDLLQLEESVDDIGLFARQTDQRLDGQQQMLSHLRDELVWASMIPLSEVLNRFPRILRDLSATYHKPVQLKLTGTSVLVDKAILEKLYDPLLHLLRNAFAHGIEPPDIRRQQGKPETGQIEIRAYHKGNQTIVEVRDDGQGLNLDRIQQRARETGWFSVQQLAALSPQQFLELIFEPGFSTAGQVSELSGRGIGLDVVRSQLQSMKGSIRVFSNPNEGTVFTLYLPLNLSITKLIVTTAGPTTFAFPTDSIEEVLSPQPDQIDQSNLRRQIKWRENLIPIYRLTELLEYTCPLPISATQKSDNRVYPENWGAPILILKRDQELFALEVDQIVTEQELVIKPFGTAIAPPPYTYGCTILGDGALVPVIDGITLMEQQILSLSNSATLDSVDSDLTAVRDLPPLYSQRVQAPTILVIDDAVMLRRTLALALEKAGFQVLQARDGQEAISQLQQARSVQLIICDIEMPNMNGFEFLSYRRQDPQLAQIPIVMLTSRSNDKHRWLAMQLGASAYFTKPYMEQEFIDTLKSLLAQAQEPH